MKLEDTVTWRARHFGLAFRMTSAISEYDYPHRFVDEQQRGPFRRGGHEHTFTALANGATQMTDIVEFRSPLGPWGPWPTGWCSLITCRTCSASATPGSRTRSKRADNCPRAVRMQPHMARQA